MRLVVQAGRDKRPLFSRTKDPECNGVCRDISAPSMVARRSGGLGESRCADPDECFLGMRAAFDCCRGSCASDSRLLGPGVSMIAHDV